LGDLGVAASLVDDTHDQHKTVIQNRRINFDEATTSHSPHPIVPIVQPNTGKRKSFVGTVSAEDTYIFLPMSSQKMLYSHVGWPLS
jgi:hypothetical protein